MEKDIRFKIWQDWRGDWCWADSDDGFVQVWRGFDNGEDCLADAEQTTKDNDEQKRRLAP